jgi:hypothetical protein
MIPPALVTFVCRFLSILKSRRRRNEYGKHQVYIKLIHGTVTLKTRRLEGMSKPPRRTRAEIADAVLEAAATQTIPEQQVFFKAIAAVIDGKSRVRRGKAAKGHYTICASRNGVEISCTTSGLAALLNDLCEEVKINYMLPYRHTLEREFFLPPA